MKKRAVTLLTLLAVSANLMACGGSDATESSAENDAEQIGAEDMHELLFAYELKERLLVCQVLIEHLKNRKETRWHSFNENLDHPETDQKFEKYVNSRMEDGKIRILFRDLVKGDTYEHTNS